MEEAVALLEASREAARGPDLDLLEAEFHEKKGRTGDAEEIYRRILDREKLTSEQRIRAAARLARCLADRSEARQARTLVEQTILDVGPHPDLLDARGMAMIAAGDFSAAIPHFTEAALAPSPARLLHLAHALCLVGDSATAAAQMQRATKLGLEPATLRPSDRQQMEVVLQRLGMQ